jgi:hypothetical protein
LPRADPAEQPDVRTSIQVSLLLSLKPTQVASPFSLGLRTGAPSCQRVRPGIRTVCARSPCPVLPPPPSASEEVKKRGGDWRERERVLSLLFSAVGVFSELSEAQG